MTETFAEKLSGTVSAITNDVIKITRMRCFSIVVEFFKEKINVCRILIYSLKNSKNAISIIQGPIISKIN